MPAFRKYVDGNFPNTELIANRILGLPKYRDLHESSLDLISQILLAGVMNKK
jgi:dTDP-4-amino-4,6-dideoxygalactose transaminase